MSLQDTSQIDVIIKSPTGFGAELILLDSGEVTDEERRFELLIKKLACYAEYVAGGQYKEQLPNFEPKDIIIRVICKNPPNEKMKQVISIVNHDDPQIPLSVVMELEEDYRHRISRK